MKNETYEGLIIESITPNYLETKNKDRQLKENIKDYTLRLVGKKDTIITKAKKYFEEILIGYQEKKPVRIYLDNHWQISKLELMTDSQKL